MAATRTSWKTCPLPEKFQDLSLQRTFTPPEAHTIFKGFVPEEMEQKWFIFYEDDWLYFHRSWTGYCIYWIRLIPSAVGFEIAESWVSRDNAQYTSNDVNEDRELLSRLIDSFLLGKR